MSGEAQARYFTSGELVNKKPVLLSEWPSQQLRRSVARSIKATASTIKAKALPKRLAALGVKA